MATTLSYCWECMKVWPQPDIFGDYTEICPHCGSLLRYLEKEADKTRSELGEDEGRINECTR